MPPNPHAWPGRLPATLRTAAGSAIEGDVTFLVLRAATDRETQVSGRPRDGDIYADAIGHFVGLAISGGDLRHFIGSTISRY